MGLVILKFSESLACRCPARWAVFESCRPFQRSFRRGPRPKSDAGGIRWVDKVGQKRHRDTKSGFIASKGQEAMLWAAKKTNRTNFLKNYGLVTHSPWHVSRRYLWAIKFIDWFDTLVHTWWDFTPWLKTVKVQIWCWPWNKKARLLQSPYKRKDEVLDVNRSRSLFFCHL